MIQEKFSKHTDLTRIFKEEMEFFNPDETMQDTSEFLNYILDKLHEEIVDINNAKVSLLANAVTRSEHTIKDSAVWQIFGSTLKTQYQIDAQAQQTKYDPSYQIMVDIQEDECTIEDCLDAYFSEDIIESEKNQNIKQQITLEKLPNVLVINVKRFTYDPKM